MNSVVDEEAELAQKQDQKQSAEPKQEQPGRKRVTL